MSSSLMRRRALELRAGMTDAEMALWSVLRGRKFSGYKFRRQYVIDDYVVDFVCLAHKLIIELDGNHHAASDARRYDAARSKRLEARGFRVVRFWNQNVVTEIDVVLGTIRAALEMS